MDEINSPQKLNFITFIVSYISLSVIAGLFSYRLLNSFMDNILLPLLDFTLLPDSKFHKFTKVYNNNKENIKNNFNKSEYVYVFKPGLFIKEIVIWCFIMIFLYFIYMKTQK